jgi:TRAP-type uncharacterized transport system fused permease subunit
LLGIGELQTLIMPFISGMIGTLALASSLQGWLLGQTSLLVRILLFIGAMLLIMPGFTSNLIGIACIFLAGAMQKYLPVQKHGEI